MTSQLKIYPSSISGVCGKMELMSSVDLPSSLEQKCYYFFKLTIRSQSSALQIDVFVELCAIYLYESRKAVISLSVCTCTHVRIGTVRMFFPFFVSDGHLCFSLIFFVILLAGRVSVCASTHVRMCSPLILAGCCLRLIDLLNKI